MKFDAHKCRALVGATGIAALAMSAAVAPAAAQNTDGERFSPTIWIDPDGCEHWVMDDGVEGYMDLKRDRDGKPTCHPINSCATLGSDQLFATNSYALTATARDHLKSFFTTEPARSFVVVGHTDSRASDAYNMTLSLNRAKAVAAVGQSVGAKISGIKGYGERQPIASNATVAGMSKNRRVEIICVK